MRPKQPQVRKTLLMVGEGDSEAAFLKHLRDLYCSGGAGVNVTVRNAQGKGPENGLGYAIKQSRIYSYDACVVLLDTDIPWTDALKKQARKAKIEMIGSSPCLEGLLIAILGERPPLQSSDCKKMIQRWTGLQLLERHSYGRFFPKAKLESARTSLQELDRLLRFYQGL